MDLDQFKHNWQEQEMSKETESLGYDKIIAFDKGLEKENLNISIMFSATIFILGFFVLPILRSTTEQMLVGALFFLMGFQALLFWMRNLNVRRSFGETPRVYIKSLIRKLKYNLTVSRYIMPIYLVLLGTIISFYTYELMSSFEIALAYIMIAISFTWAYLIGVYIFGRRKQLQKDRGVIVPMISELEEILQTY